MVVVHKVGITLVVLDLELLTASRASAIHLAGSLHHHIKIYAMGINGSPAEFRQEV